MPQLYDTERRERNATLLSKIKYGLSVYYFFIACLVFAPQNLDDGRTVIGLHLLGSGLFDLIFLVILPVVGVVFYSIGLVTNYQPKERFLPKPTVNALFARADRADGRSGKEKRAHRIYDKIRSEDRKQRREDTWRSALKAKYSVSASVPF